MTPSVSVRFWLPGSRFGVKPTRRGGWALMALMGRPLDLLDVDPLLDHLVERRHLAEPVHLADDVLDHEVHLLLGVEPADPEPDARVGQLVADAQRPQDVARFEAGAGARRPA